LVAGAHQTGMAHHLGTSVADRFGRASLP
jgi:hypothetical protein